MIVMNNILFRFTLIVKGLEVIPYYYMDNIQV